MATFSLCYLLAVIIAIILIVWGFWLIFQVQQNTETEVQVLQRQLRGFAFLILASIVLVAGVAVCSPMVYTA